MTATLIANAGLLLHFRGVTILLDGVFDGNGHDFSAPPPEMRHRMLRGWPPFEEIDYLVFSHLHPDHFSPELTLELLRRRRVKGVFLPEDPAVEGRPLSAAITALGVPCTVMEPEGRYQLGDGVTLTAMQTRHLGQEYRGVRHFCPFISSGGDRLLFTADADYTAESFDEFREMPLRAVFVTPLFFDAIRRGRFFRGNFQTRALCAYHVPFAGDDSQGLRPMLEKALASWPQDSDVRTEALWEAMQELTL